MNIECLTYVDYINGEYSGIIKIGNDVWTHNGCELKTYIMPLDYILVPPEMGLYTYKTTVLKQIETRYGWNTLTQLLDILEADIYPADICDIIEHIGHQFAARISKYTKVYLRKVLPMYTGCRTLYIRNLRYLNECEDIYWNIIQTAVPKRVDSSLIQEIFGRKESQRIYYTVWMLSRHSPIPMVVIRACIIPHLIIK